MKMNRVSAAVAAATVASTRIVTGTKASINAKGELLIYGLIGDWWDELDAESVVRQAEAAAAGKDELIVRVHSEGGNLVAGLAIYNALKQSEKRVVVYVDGIAASMASAVVCAADVVRMPTNALMMIHKPHLVAQGNADDLRDIAGQVDVLEASYLDCYVQKGKQTAEELRALISDGKDHWLTAAQCLEMGLCDEILAEPIAVAASYDPKQFHNPPAALWGGLVFQPKAAVVAQPLENEAMFKIVASGGGMLAAAIMAALAGAYTSVEAALKALAHLNVQDLDKVLVGDVKATDEVLTQLAGALGVKTESDPSAGNAPANPPADVAAVAAQAVARERTRITDLQALGRKYDLSAEQVEDFSRRGITLAEARSEALDLVAARTAANQPRPGVRVTHTGGPLIAAAMAVAILNRFDPTSHPLDDASKPFAHLSLIEMARAHLQAFGVDVSGMAPSAVATMAMQTSSDFVHILADVANKSLRMGYEAAPRTFTRFCRRVTASDFKAINRAQIGSGGGSLPKVNEKGEYTRGILVDGKESYGLATYGEVLAVTRRTLINDDLDALSRIPMMQGAQVAETESELVWALIINNVDMSDAVPLFDSDHGNLGGGVIGDVGLSAGRLAMRTQTKLDGVTPLNLSPTFLIVPAALETTAQKQLALIQPNVSTSVNPFAGSMELLVEARLDANDDAEWYLSADPNRIDTIEYAYLEGQEGAYLETRQGFDTDGVEMKVRLDFGAGVIDYRGLYKSSGS